jgi:ABC-type transporter MlaC component
MTREAPDGARLYEQPSRSGRFFDMSRGIAAMTRAVLFAPLFTLNRPAKVVLEVRRNLPTELVQKAVEELLGDKAVVARTVENFFDLREMAKKSLGGHWVARSPQERDEFVRLFRGMLSRVWLRTLKTGKRITYYGGDGDLHPRHRA